MREWGRRFWAWQHEAGPREQRDGSTAARFWHMRETLPKMEQGFWRSTSTGFPCVTVAAGNTFLPST